MRYKEWQKKEQENMDMKLDKVENLGSFLRWAFDYYTPYWMKINLLDLLSDAALEHDIDDDVIDNYIAKDIWDEFNTEDGNSELSEWFSELIGEEANSSYFYKYGQRRAWDDVMNALTEIIMEYTEFDEDEANDHANDGTFNFEDTFDEYEVNVDDALEILENWF